MLNLKHNHIGECLIYEDGIADDDLVEIVAVLRDRGVVAVFFDGAGNEHWASGIFNPDGTERGPSSGRLMRFATTGEIARLSVLKS